MLLNIMRRWKNKDLLLIPEFDPMTLEQVVDYYEVDPQWFYAKNTDKLEFKTYPEMDSWCGNEPLRNRSIL